MATIQEIRDDINQKLEQLQIDGFAQAREDHLIVFIIGEANRNMHEYPINTYPEISDYNSVPFGLARKLVYIYTAV